MIEAKCDVLGQAIVEKLGAEIRGTKLKLSDFLVQDGEHEGDDLTAQCKDWLNDRGLIHSKSVLSIILVLEVGVGRGIEIHVQEGIAKTEYQFLVLEDKTPESKSFHYVEVSVLILAENSDI
jgi:hypothetical protein